MRSSPASGINYPLLLAVLALHYVMFAWALQPVAPRPLAPRSADSQTQPPPPGQATSPPATQQGDGDAADDAPAGEPDDPRQAFTPQQWRDNQRRAESLRRQQQLGALAQGAPAQLPRELQRGLADGQRDAARAAAALHDECSTLDTGAEPSTPPTLLRDIAAPLQPLVRARFDARLQRLREQAARCAAWAQAQTALAQARRDYAGRTDADAYEALRSAQQLEPATPGLLDRLRTGLEQLWRQNSDAAVGRNLALLLLDEHDATRREIGLRLLQQLAENDDREVDFVTQVLHQGHGRLLPQPVLAARWQRRAADLGSDTAIDSELQQPALRSAPEQAWSWHAWRVWLNAQGCYLAASRPDDTLLADDLRALQQLDRQLDPPARARAGRQYREHLAQWGERARDARNCADPAAAGAPR
jgi:hypothetical protein